MEYMFLVLLVFVTSAHAHSCLPCDVARCKNPTDCAGGLTLDACKCCRVCARVVNEICGGLYKTHGLCDTGLTCVIQPKHGGYISGNEIGICKSPEDMTPTETCKKVDYEGCNVVDGKCVCSSATVCSNPFRFQNKMLCTLQLLEIEKKRKDCSNWGYKCKVTYSPNCPDDSELVDSVWPAGECCPLPSTCECRKGKCKQPLCRHGYNKVLIRKATRTPGQCCDVYQCQPIQSQCTDVECPRVNRNVTCPSDSVKITDRMSKDGCCELSPKCHCKSSICPESKCLGGFQPIITVRGTGRPGTCCDIIECVRVTPRGSCSFNGTLYKHGEHFRPEPCRKCECTSGIYHCTREQCEKLPCKKQYIPEGRCCPKCRITMEEPRTTIKPYRVCTDDTGEAHWLGEVWFQDPCTRCVCKSNGPKCIASSCQKNCEHPRIVEGECCGVCDEPTFMTIPSSRTCPSMKDCKLTGKECPFGFESDDLGCRLCNCKKKSEVCQSMASCRLKCSHGFIVNAIGCEICQCHRGKECKNTTCTKTCPFGYRKDRNGCSRCRCIRCKNVVASCDKRCKHGRVMNDYGCEICKCRSDLDSSISPEVMRSLSCTDAGRKRDDGEEWTASGRQCVCRRGNVLCDMLKCAVPHCDHPVLKDDSACAVCPDSAPYSAEPLTCGSRVEGETWQPDSCTSCVCNSGRVMCEYQQCDPAPCSKPVYTEDHCCPICKNESDMETGTASCVTDEGIKFEHDTAWRSDKCTSCKCVNGQIKCFGDKCPQVHNCLHPVVKRDQCCPQCLDDDNMNQCHVGDRIYTHGEVWSMKSDDCATCSCVHGNIFCRKKLCRPVEKNCKVTKKESCCDVCASSSVVTIESETKEKTSNIILPICLGVGALIGVIAAVIVFIIYKKRKDIKPTLYQGHIKEEREGHDVK